jgi:hypothetical protein
MRLLNTEMFKLEEFLGYEKPKYAILSHTWGKQEVLFEMKNLDMHAYTWGKAEDISDETRGTHADVEPMVLLKEGFR